MSRTHILLVACLLVPSAALAQSATPEWELATSYQFTRVDIGAVQNLADSLTKPAGLPAINAGHDLNTNGYNVSIQENKTRSWGGIVETGGAYGTEHIDLSKVAQSLGLVPSGTSVIAKFTPALYTVSAGPQFTYRNGRKVQPFLRVEGGFAHASIMPDILTKTELKDYAPTFKTSDRSFVLIGGLGADYRVSPRLAIRAAGDYERTWLFHEHQSNLRLIVGIVFRVGTK